MMQCREEASVNIVSPTFMHANPICRNIVAILVSANRYQTRSRSRSRIYRWCSGRGRSCWRHPPYRRSAAPGGRAGGRYLAKKVCPQVCQVGGERGQNQVIRVVRSHSRSSKESQSQEEKLTESSHALPLHGNRVAFITRIRQKQHAPVQNTPSAHF